jgi:dihydroorotate dehydrogenase
MNRIRAFLWKGAKHLLFKFDPETAHRVTLLLIRLGILLGNLPLHIASGSNLRKTPKENQNRLVFGMEFRSRVGLAAGFDKNAEILIGIPALGFGFAEVGTVTPRPQAGNLRPRLFRDVEGESLFNRMGFNGLGATIVSEKLKQDRDKLPGNFRVGVNLGKNKDTPQENSWTDYVQAARPFEGLADYLVVNVSSPNTPGLRALQSVDSLRPILEGMNTLISKWRKKPPLLLKLAPELNGSHLIELVQAVEPLGVDGWVLTNTLAGHYKRDGQDLPGGWSGRLLKRDSLQSLITVRKISQKPIISVGGILSSADAIERISHGADLVQVYTGWIYRGPSFPAEIAHQVDLETIKTRKPQA